MLNPSEHMDHIREHWGACAAKQKPPTPVYIILTHDGHLVGWAWSRPAAQKLAKARIVNCHVARLDPRDY